MLQPILVSFLEAIISALANSNGQELSNLLALPQDFTQDNYLALMPVIDSTNDPVPLGFWNSRVPADAVDELWPEFLRQHLKALSVFHKLNLGIQKNAAKGAYQAWLAACQTFLRIFQSGERWILPVAYELCEQLWKAAKDTEDSGFMEEAARLVNKAFTICITDRNPEDKNSRKWGTYRCAGMLFKIYFSLGQLNLCNNVIRAINAAPLPDLDEYPAAHQVTFRYYLGRFHFVNERYQAAHEALFQAFAQCHKHGFTAKRQILHYLIPVRFLVTGSIPTIELMARYKLDTFYPDAFTLIRSGRIREYHRLLEANEHALFQMGTFLIWERIQLVCYCSALKLLWRLEEKSSRLTLDKIQIAFGNMQTELEEVGCLLANLIAVGLVKGYLSQERATLVVSQKSPFGSVALSGL